MSQGYIKLHRQLQSCWIWVEDEVFDRRSAWIDLLLMVNHADKKLLFEGKLMTVKKGQVVTSILKLSERWGWDRKKTKKFLDLLESDEMVTTERTTHGTTITIVNWDKYQLGGTTDGTTNGSTATPTVGQPLPQPFPINNNDKEYIKNEKNNNRTFIPPSIDEVKEYCRERHNNVDADAFINFYESKGWMVGKNKMKDWKAAVRTWEKNSKPSRSKPSGDDLLDDIERLYTPRRQ